MNFLPSLNRSVAERKKVTQNLRALALTAMLCGLGMSVSAVPSIAKPAKSAVAQTAANIRFLEDSKLFVLDGGAVSYVLGINETGQLQHVYWGARLWRDSDLVAARTAPQRSSQDVPSSLTSYEYAGWGADLYTEPGVKVTFGDGSRDLVLVYVSHRIKGRKLVIVTKDVRREVYVDLSYTIIPDSGLLERHATVRNQTSEAIIVESAQSAQLSLPVNDDYRLRSLTGRWTEDFQIKETPVVAGSIILESRRGHTSNQANPWFAIDHNGSNDPENGEVWFGALAWNGNWRIDVEKTPNHGVKVTGGFNTFDFAYSLDAGKSLETPEFYAGYTAKGIGEAARIFHRFQRQMPIRADAAKSVRPVIYNSWEATGFDVNEVGQKTLADRAASLGVELFVIDDGWFGQRNDDTAGLGDWTVNPKKFPNGLKPLIDHVKGLGMEFGLWVEPEMVNANSDLYRAHPEWILQFPDRPKTEARTQYVLNLARPDVAEYVYNVMDEILAQNDIRFIKWDHNRGFSEPGWTGMPPDKQRNLWVEYSRNLDSIIDRLRAKYPNVEFQACASGGGRVDLSMLARSEQVWPSDNTEALDRLLIQDGFTYAYTPQVMEAWVTDVPGRNGRTTPMRFRFLVAMQGALGIGADLNHWDAAQMAEAKAYVALYKRVRPIVQQGDLYKLTPSGQTMFVANQYISEDKNKVALFVFQQLQRFGNLTSNIRLKNLEPDRLYAVTSLDTPQPRTFSGAYLMGKGLDLRFKGDYSSDLFTFEKLPLGTPKTRQ